jgi:hypothetical protein
MKAVNNNKLVWTKPVVLALNIKKNTFSGTEYGPEGASKSPTPPEPS